MFDSDRDILLKLLDTGRAASAREQDIERLARRGDLAIIAGRYVLTPTGRARAERFLNSRPRDLAKNLRGGTEI